MVRCSWPILGIFVVLTSVLSLSTAVVGEIERRKAGTQPPALQGDGGPDGNQWTAQ